MSTRAIFITLAIGTVVGMIAVPLGVWISVQPWWNSDYFPVCVLGSLIGFLVAFYVVVIWDGAKR